MVLARNEDGDIVAEGTEILESAAKRGVPVRAKDLSTIEAEDVFERRVFTTSVATAGVST